MAILKNGAISGKLGGLVYRQCRNGKIIVAQAPRKKSTGAAVSARQKNNQQKFRESILRPPVIEYIIADVNNKGVRDKIIICAGNSFNITEVKVKITNGAGELIEEGDAVCELKDLWIYTTINRHKIITGAKIMATATDLVSNKAMLEIIV